MAIAARVTAGQQVSCCVLSWDPAFANVSASCFHTCVKFNQQGVFHICYAETPTGQTKKFTETKTQTAESTLYSKPAEETAKSTEL